MLSSFLYAVCMYIGTSSTTSGIANLVVSPAQPLTNHIPQTQPVVSLKVQPERSLPLVKPPTGDGNFVFKWYI